MELLLFSLPWILVTAYLILVFRTPTPVPDLPVDGADSVPLVSVIVPARNEEGNIESCVSSLCASDYPLFEVLVVDDGSRDRTADIVGALPSGNASALRLIRGEPLPAGWFGKPWACFQGSREARGELLLFTDADTVHAPKLLGETVRGLLGEGADAYTIIGGQVMGSFWERLLQPQFFLLLAARYPRAGTPRKPSHWRHAIANGQYLLFRREAYHASGGHEAVAGEVVEDLRLAQHLVRGGWKLLVRSSRGLETRMYQSLSTLVEGWSKNVTTAALQTTVGWLQPFILPLSLVLGVTLWFLPPAAVAVALLTVGPGTLLSWGVFTTGLCVFIWSRVSALMGGNPLYGFLYPLGSLLSIHIFLKSWRRGRNIRWKDRSYEMTAKARTQPPRGAGS